MIRKTKIPLILTALFLAGCAVTLDYNRPIVNAPADWQADAAAPESRIDPNWWSNFDSAELNALIDKALAENNELQAGLYRIEQSRASLRAAGASLLPRVDVSAGASRNRSNPATGSATSNTSLRAGTGISYELDLFGANRAGVDAATASLAGTEFNQEALRLTVIGDVTRSYFNVLNLRNRVVIADDNLDILHEVLRIIEARYAVGAESALEVSRQRSTIASAATLRISLIEQLTNAENALAVLVGEPPQYIEITENSLTAVSIPSIAPMQPSSLLERRPDIRAAETGLIAANANIGIARAAYFPSLNIGLDGGLSATGFGNPVGTTLSLASSLAAPIFQGGRLEAGVEQATARQNELIINYQQTVLTAFQEVENALTAVRAAADREQTLLSAQEEARNSYDLTRQLYDAGRIDFQTLLDVQRSLLSAEDSFAQAKIDRLTAAVNLYLALGGGWV